MTRRWCIGLSSGCSLFGMDAALVRVDGQGTEMALRLEEFLHVPYGRELRDLLWHVRSTQAPELRHLATVHRVLGETSALVVRQLLEHSRLPAQEIFCIGSSGLEIWHDADGRYPANLNLGMCSVLAERTGLTTVSDFSSRDLVLGGQGLPLTALVDALLFHDPREHRVLLHLGSVATLLSLPADRGMNHRRIIGFQAAPCTLLLDGLMRLLTAGREHFDAGGKNAVQGRCLEPLL
jgi:anhydro-N-acetylmuramic acid kinase